MRHGVKSVVAVSTTILHLSSPLVAATIKSIVSATLPPV